MLLDDFRHHSEKYNLSHTESRLDEVEQDSAPLLSVFMDVQILRSRSVRMKVRKRRLPGSCIRQNAANQTLSL